MEIHVGAVELFAGDLDTMGLDAAVAQTYAEEHVRVSGGDGGYILDVADSVGQIQRHVVRYVLDLQDALRISSAEVFAACRVFESTDQAGRDEFDALVPADAYPVPPQDIHDVSSQMPDTLPTGGVDPGGGGLIQGPASAYLGEPVAADRAYSDWQSVVDVVDLLSPSTYLAKGLELTIGFNPIDELAAWMAGDWTSVAKSASAMVQLAEFSHICAVNLWASSGSGFAFWTGNTATAASNYFVALQVAIYGGDPACRSVASGLQDAATGMYDLALSLSGLISAFLDELIDIGIHALAAAGSSWSVFGGLFFGGWTVWDIKQALDLWDDILDVKSAVQGIAQAVAALVLTADPVNGEMPALPSPYDVPSG